MILNHVAQMSLIVDHGHQVDTNQTLYIYQQSVTSWIDIMCWFGHAQLSSNLLLH